MTPVKSDLHSPKTCTAGRGESGEKGYYEKMQDHRDAEGLLSGSFRTV